MSMLTFNPFRRNVACAIVFALSATSAFFSHARETLTVAHDQWIGYAGFFVAQSKGFFEQAGVEVKTTQFSGPGDTLPPLLAGHVDIALTTMYNLALLAGKGESSVQAIYILDTSNGADAIVAGGDIKTPAMLKGKKVAVTTGEVNHMLLISGLEQAGLSEKDITLVNMNADDAGAAFLAKRVDAAVTWEPWVSRATAAGGTVIFTSADTPDLILDTVSVTEKTRQEKDEALTSFLKGLDKGVAYLAAHPEESHKIIAQTLDVSTDEVAGMLAGDKIYSLEDNRRLLQKDGAGAKSLGKVASFLQSQGLIAEPVEASKLLTAELLP